MEIDLKLLVVLILSVYVLFVSLRPSVRNPDIIFILYEYPWLLVLLLLAGYYIVMWDERAGYLFFIFLIAIYFDIIMLIKRPKK